MRINRRLYIFDELLLIIWRPYTFFSCGSKVGKRFLLSTVSNKFANNKPKQKQTQKKKEIAILKNVSFHGEFKRKKKCKRKQEKNCKQKKSLQRRWSSTKQNSTVLFFPFYLLRNYLEKVDQICRAQWFSVIFVVFFF